MFFYSPLWIGFWLYRQVIDSSFLFLYLYKSKKEETLIHILNINTLSLHIYTLKDSLVWEFYAYLQVFFYVCSPVCVKIYVEILFCSFLFVFVLDFLLSVVKERNFIVCLIVCTECANRRLVVAYQKNLKDYFFSSYITRR